MITFIVLVIVIVSLVISAWQYNEPYNSYNFDPNPRHRNLKESLKYGFTTVIGMVAATVLFGGLLLLIIYAIAISSTWIITNLP